MRRILLLIIAIFGFCAGTWGQEVSFSIDAPRVAVINQYFKVEFTVNEAPDSFEAPDFGELEVVAGPIESQATSFSFINGKSTSSVSYIYTYGVIGHKEGTYTIQPAKVVVKGKEYRTQPYPIEIAKERTSRQSSGKQQGGIAPDDVLLRLSVDKREVYKGEPVLVTVKLYDRAGVAGIRDAKEPSFNGFWKQQLDGQNFPSQRETFNGKVYETQVLTQYLLFPQKSGTLEIEQMDMNVVVRVRIEQDPIGGGIWDGLLGGGPIIQDIDKHLSSSPIKINVKELPAGAPASFNGAVGQFALEGELSASQLNANSSGTFMLRITGSGNLPLLNAPKIELPGTFDLYDVKTTDKYNTSYAGITGYKQYEYPFIARAEGQYEIGPFEFSYFDPKEGRYKTISTSAFPLEVLRDISGGANSPGIVSGVTKEELKILGKDIHFIKVGAPQLEKTDSFFIGSWLYILILVLMMVICAGTLFYLQKRIKELRDTVRVKNKRANKVASRRLKQAQQYMHNGKESDFYEEMMRALTGYVSDKLNIPIADLSKENIRNELLQRGISENDVTGLLQIISDCEFARYSPGASIQMNNIYQSALDLIGRFENKL